MNDFELGDYTLTHGSYLPGYYDIYLHDECVGWVLFDIAMSSLYEIWANDTNLITMLLLKYQVLPDFKIYPY